MLLLISAMCLKIRHLKTTHSIYKCVCGCFNGCTIRELFLNATLFYLQSSYQKTLSFNNVIKVIISESLTFHSRAERSYLQVNANFKKWA